MKKRKYRMDSGFDEDEMFRAMIRDEVKQKLLKNPIQTKVFKFPRGCKGVK